MIPRRSLTRCASTQHERDNLVASNALASSPAVSGDAYEILVPAEPRIKNPFATIKQTVSHSERGCLCEQHSLVVDRVTDSTSIIAQASSHKHHRTSIIAQASSHKHAQITSWVCT
jgi:hypothetical protein